MPGLWPRGTAIYKWKQNVHKRRPGNQDRPGNYNRNHGESNAYEVQSRRGSSGSYVAQTQRRQDIHATEMRLRPDQQRHRQQWRD